MEIIKVTDIASEIIGRCQIGNLQTKAVPVLATVLLGDSLENVIRVGFMEGALKSVDWISRHVVLPAEVSLSQVLEEIDKLNLDQTIDGIFVQLPLPEQLLPHTVTILQSIAPQKDVGGLNPINRVLLGADQSAVIPSAPAACLEIIHKIFPSLSGKSAWLVGDSFDLVIPLAVLLLKQGINVNIWPEVGTDTVLAAEIVVTEAGAPKLFKKENFIPGSLVIDAGFYRHFGHPCGNVDVSSLEELEGWLVSFPNSLHFVINAKVMENLYLAARSRHE